MKTIAMVAAHTKGTAKRMKAASVAVRSLQELGWVAEYMPSGMAMKYTRSNESVLSLTVTGTRSTILFQTGWLSLKDSPKLRVKRFFNQMAYWTGTRRSRPYC